MFESLSDRLSQTFRQIGGKANLSEDNIKTALRDVRMALLEADVALPVVKAFTESIKQRAMGQEVSESLSPGQTFLKIVQTELQLSLGEANEGLNLSAKAPVIILLAGLQGAGKTTTVAKLARHLKDREKKTVSVVSADVYRPAAIKQLETLASEVNAHFCPSSTDEKPLAIVTEALNLAKRNVSDVLIVDTAGRLAIDENMMREIGELHKALNPAETLFVVDSMTGQDAANTAKAFNDVLPLTGVVLTKIDADTRGGAALSVRQITGKPIKFMGVGEKTAALEPFHPDRIASRILGMGDVMSLIEEAEMKIDKRKANRLARKVKKGRGFDLEDFKDQLQQMKNMGGLGSMLEKMPGMAGMAEMAEQQAAQKQFGQMEAIINSMTPKERRQPDILNGSRKRRITKGSGTQLQDLNRLIKQHKQMQKMMKKMKGGGLANMMRGLGGMGGGMGGAQGGMGGLPPGFKLK